MGRFTSRPSTSRQGASQQTPRQTDEERAAKLQAVHDRLSEAVGTLQSEPKWRAWLAMNARLHNYSFNNTLLITSQCPDASMVAGFSAWKAMGRSVTKGEKGIAILAPIVARGRTDAASAGSSAQSSGQASSTTTPAASSSPLDRAAGGDNDARRTGVVGFRVTYVWDISQTNGDPVPERPEVPLLRGTAPEGLWEGLAQIATEQGYDVAREHIAVANGFTNFAERKVRVSLELDDAAAVKTLAHELGHILLHDPAEQKFSTLNCRGTGEIEAESVAFVVGEARGLDTSSYSTGYVLNWSAAVQSGQNVADVIAATGRRVVAASHTILATLEEIEAKNAATGATATKQENKEETKAAITGETKGGDKEQTRTACGSHSPAQEVSGSRTPGQLVSAGMRATRPGPTVGGKTPAAAPAPSPLPAVVPQRSR